MVGRQHASNEADRVVRHATWTGLVANLALMAVKLGVGWLSSSQALVADGVHSLSDLSTDIGLLIGLRFWSKPRDAEHPYGHRRLELVFAISIGLLLVATAVAIAAHATLTYGKAQPVPHAAALAVALLSICAKEALYRWTVHRGRLAKSVALTANAWHHRSDALSSVPAALSVAVILLWPELVFVDAIGAVVVAFFILQGAGAIIFPSVRKLVDTAPPESLRQAILDVAEQTEGVESAHAMRTRYLGAALSVDIHVEVDPLLTVQQGHTIAQHLEERLQDRIEEVVDVLVHVEPAPRPPKT